METSVRKSILSGKFCCYTRGATTQDFDASPQFLLPAELLQYYPLKAIRSGRRISQLI